MKYILIALLGLTLTNCKPPNISDVVYTAEIEHNCNNVTIIEQGGAEWALLDVCRIKRLYYKTDINWKEVKPKKKTPTNSNGLLIKFTLW